MEQSTYPNDIKNYENIRIIGRGSSGYVYEAVIIKGNHLGEHVAIKEVNLESLEDKSLENLSNEITIMCSIQHDNLIRTYATLTNYHTIYIIMPLMSYGSLSQILAFKYPDGIKNEEIIATVMRDCLNAINCLNENHLFHRDIKAANILISSDGVARLGDYGVSAVITQGGRDSFVGSLCWMAPEVAARTEYNHKIDIWSLGITAIELAMGKPPFMGLSTFDSICKIVNGNPPQVVDSKYQWDQTFIDFVNSCLVKEPNKRPNAEEILSMNKKFFALAKDKTFLLNSLLKGVSTVEERFGKNIQDKDEYKKNSEHKIKVEWDFGNDIQQSTALFKNSDLEAQAENNEVISGKINTNTNNNNNNGQTTQNAIVNTKKESTSNKDIFKDVLEDI